MSTSLPHGFALELQDLGKTRVELKAGKIKAREETSADPDIPSVKSETYTPRTHASRTDPDSTVVRRDGYRSHLYYKSHCTIDGAKRIITDCFVTTGSKHECTVFKERVDYVTQRFNLKPEEWLADRGYGHGPAMVMVISSTAKKCGSPMALLLRGIFCSQH